MPETEDCLGLCGAPASPPSPNPYNTGIGETGEVQSAVEGDVVVELLGGVAPVAEALQVEDQDRGQGPSHTIAYRRGIS